MDSVAEVAPQMQWSDHGENQPGVFGAWEDALSGVFMQAAWLNDAARDGSGPPGRDDRRKVL